MTGILLIDKPSGPTSHDVVARMRRATGERSLGHAGTLDPLATGVLVLLLGRATRLASYLTSHDKSYEAAIRLGVSTDTYDALGQPRSSPGEASPLPGLAAVEAAIETFRGTFDQTPPAHSAKRVGGVKAYDLARRARPVVLSPVPVTVRRLDLLEYAEGRLTLRVTATAGFYVRSLAHDLGVRLGCGAHLEALRRTASGHFRVEDAVALEEAERLGPSLETRLIGPAEALAEFPAVELTELGLQRAAHGNWIAPEHVRPGAAELPSGAPRVRLLTAGGRLIGLAEPRRGALHPVVVLG
jgi:tRNA pseudouridine55 synthase